MKQRKEADYWSYTGEILKRMHNEGVLCTVTDDEQKHNVITLGWGQTGPFYHGRPVFIIAVAKPRYSWCFLEEVSEFTIAVPDDNIKKAVSFCGNVSGRSCDKFDMAGLTPVPGINVRTVSILECPLNIECRIYTRINPPHMLLTPEHRKRPLEEQHTIYFAEVLGAYLWQN
jgi:flavin reductase (DIM6/NTAB) family NADH-FMN oxidoreductase RutF